MNMLLSKEQIIAAQDRRYIEVDVPEWGGKVRLASLDADQSLKHEQMLLKLQKTGDTKSNPLVAMLADSIVNDQGDRVFDAQTMATLGKKNPVALRRLIAAMKKLNNQEEDGGEGNASATQDAA
jgi:hypothetical protein